MKKLLIKCLIVVSLLCSIPAQADIIDDCIKCPALETIFSITYEWTYIA